MIMNFSTNRYLIVASKRTLTYNFILNDLENTFICTRHDEVEVYICINLYIKKESYFVLSGIEFL